MKITELKTMVKGWFVGDFEPTVLKTQAAEVAIKTYRAGDHDACHYHKVATEITVIVSGEVEMAGRRLQAGQIILLEPGEKSDFKVLKDTTTVVVKVPGAPQDKYLVDA